MSEYNNVLKITHGLESIWNPNIRQVMWIQITFHNISNLKLLDDWNNNEGWNWNKLPSWIRGSFLLSNSSPSPTVQFKSVGQRVDVTRFRRTTITIINIYRNERYYCHGILHIDLTHKIKTMWQVPCGRLSMQHLSRWPLSPLLNLSCWWWKCSAVLDVEEYKYKHHACFFGQNRN